MNILHIESSKNWGGQEYRSQDEIQWLRAHGHNAWLICDPTSKPFEQAQKVGLDPLPLHFHNALYPFNIWRLWRFCRQHKVALIKTHSSRDSWLCWPLFLMGYVVVRSCNIVRCVTRTHRAFIFRHGCNGIIAAANCIKDSLVNLTRVEPASISVIGEFVDFHRFHPNVDGSHFRQELQVVKGTPLIGMISMLRGDKGVLSFVDSAVTTLGNVPSARFIIVGDGPERQKVDSRIKSSLARFKINPVERDNCQPIRVLGYRYDIPQILAGLDIVVIPSWSEARCRVLAEAMAMGKPVVAFDVGGIPELLKDGQNGLLVQSHDTALLSEAIQRLILDASLRQRLGEAGLKTAQAELCIDAVMDRTVKFYKDLLEGSTSAQDDNKLIEIELRGEKFVG